MTQPQPDPHENLKYIEDHDFESNRVTTYLKGDFLGKGGFARCYELISQQTKQVFAVKIIQKSSLTKAKSKQKLMSEINIHQQLDHYNIVKFRHNFEDNLNVYIVLEICTNKTLNDLIKRKRRLTQNQVRYFMLQVLEALEYLHSKKIIHRDLKLGNLFLDENMHVKMGDFGLATKICFPGQKRRTICGTPNYIAPEILQSKGHSYEVDVWSFGVIMYTLVYGRPPFQSKDVKETYKKIKSAVFSFPDTLSLVISTLQKDPSKRPTIKQLKEFTFFQQTNLTRQASLCFKSQCQLSATKQKDQRQLSDNGKLYTNNDLATSKDTFQKSHDRLLGTQRGSSHKRSSTNSNLSRVKSHRILKQNSQRNSVQKASNFTNQFNGALLQSNSNKNMFDNNNTPVKSKKPIENPFKGFENRSESKTAQPKTTKNQYISVKKWIDYSSKYGIGYILSNNSYGVFFNDSTKVLSLSEVEFYYIEKMQRQDIYKKYSFKDYPTELKKKVSLFIHFKGYLSNQNQNNQPMPGAFDNSSKLKLTARKTQRVHIQTAPQKLVYVRRWFRSKHAVIFRLSNKSVQVIFVDQSQLLISSIKKQILYINKKKQRTHYNLSQIMSCQNKQLIKRFQYTKDILNQMVNVHDNNGKK